MQKYTNKDAEILEWAKQRNAHPVERAPFRPDGEPAQLGFVFGEAPLSEEFLQPIPWSRFLAVFHLMGLALVYGGDNDYELVKVEGDKSGPSERRAMQA